MIAHYRKSEGYKDSTWFDVENDTNYGETHFLKFEVPKMEDSNYDLGEIYLTTESYMWGVTHEACY